MAELPFLTVTQTADLLQIGRSKAYALTVEWDRTGGAPASRSCGSATRSAFPYDALMDWIDHQLDPPPAA